MMMMRKIVLYSAQLGTGNGTGRGGTGGQEEALTRFVGALLWIYNTVVSVAWSLSVQVYSSRGDYCG